MKKNSARAERQLSSAGAERQLRLRYKRVAPHTFPTPPARLHVCTHISDLRGCGVGVLRGRAAEPLETAPSRAPSSRATTKP
jgi:hypothetical protein